MELQTSSSYLRNQPKTTKLQAKYQYFDCVKRIQASYEIVFEKRKQVGLPMKD